MSAHKQTQGERYKLVIVWDDGLVEVSYHTGLGRAWIEYRKAQEQSGISSIDILDTQTGLVRNPEQISLT